ncbi:MAG: CDP-alcohol phosphatidyltransferase family protein [Chloroflexi bacterium]|nr:CDP-alcohol phosphatidyltransferase family protein [Chloroflexota bacterium]
MVISRLRAPAQGLLRPVALGLARAGLTPNTLTVLGLVLNVAAGLVLATGQPLWGAAAVLVASFFDMLDGLVARVAGRATPFGAFLDSTLDRYAEAALCGGILVWHVRDGQVVEALLSYAAVIGSLLVSYARARAEGLGLHGEVGWLPRPERVALLAAGLLLGALWPLLWTAALALLALLTNLTAVQRIVYVRRQLEKASVSDE